MRDNTTGNGNAAFGVNSLASNQDGSLNVALGQSALTSKTSGNGNIAVGTSAGVNLTTGSDNIYIGNLGGAPTESGQIRIGNSTDHAKAFIAGIESNVVEGSPVLVATSGELGVEASAARFKRDVHDMATTSSVLMDLRPVTFLYRDEVGGANDERQYGLIAEEVAKVSPDLVRFDEDGAPFSVHYERLAPMLLNEMQKQQRTIETLLARVQALEGRPGAAALGANR